MTPLRIALVALCCSASVGAQHSLDYADSPEARRIVIDAKVYVGADGRVWRDKIFRDGYGREAYFRGWNVSGKTKHVESGFKPFINTGDATIGLGRLAEMAGPNMVRFAIAWEGVHPAPDRIDTVYLDQVAAQMKVAIGRGMYVLLDYHQDLFSRHLFNAKSWHTGNGAPAWITPKGMYPAEYCGIVCASWSQHNLTDEAVRRAFRNFWNNAPLPTVAGERRMQDEFLWQTGRALAYLKNRLSPAEFDMVLGLDPFNEPVDGGMEGLSAKQWDNQKLWPFYRRVRAAMDANGWGEKWVYAEPLVFWNTTAGVVAPATGGHHLDAKPGPGFVFNSHFYDAGRMGVDLRGVDNGTYLPHLDQIRTEARFLDTPVFLSEFGMWLKDKGARDTVRILKSTYQGMEISDAMGGRTRWADFYAPLVSGTQWHWDYYYDRHREYQNGATLVSGRDGWNNENFSVVRDESRQYNLDQRLVERAYPRRAQGDILHFHYQDLSRDDWGKLLNWASVVAESGQPGRFGDEQFALLTWRGRRGEAPTEIYLPRHWRAEDLLVLTEKRVHAGDLVRDAALSQVGDEVALGHDPNGGAAGGHLLRIWDDAAADENPDSVHFALVVNRQQAGSRALGAAQLEALREALTQALCRERRSVLYLTGKMTLPGYPG